MAGIYFHIPFCKRKCGYCDFYSVTSAALREPVLGAMLRELEAQKAFIPDTSVNTIYIGGGTPSLCAPRELGRLISAVGNHWDVSGLEEVTVEVNPDDVDKGYFEGLLREGVNRLSIGIQSFDDDALRFMGRRHDARSAERAFFAAREAGFGNISIDLIYGLPGMDTAVWRSGIERAIGLSPEHISAYHLTVESDTPFGRLEERGEMKQIEDAESERQYALLHELLSGNGYERYEISNFALPGRRARHNSAYWNGANYLGIGPSAHSYNGSARMWCIADAGRFIEGGAIYTTEILSDRDCYNEYIMTRLRTSDGIIIEEMNGRLGAECAQKFLDDARPLIADGRLVRLNGRINIPAARIFVSDSIIAELFED